MTDDVTLPQPDWTALPPRARALFIYDNILIFGFFGLVFGGLSFILRAFDYHWSLIAALASGAVAIGIAIGVYRGIKVFRNFRWRLDDDGLGIRKGHMWMSEIRVPIQRVQHLNLSRGPLQRPRSLATLSVFTAGTANSSVKLPNMDSDTAEAIREYLSSRIDWVDE